MASRISYLFIVMLHFFLFLVKGLLKNSFDWASISVTLFASLFDKNSKRSLDVDRWKGLVSKGGLFSFIVLYLSHLHSVRIKSSVLTLFITFRVHHSFRNVYDFILFSPVLSLFLCIVYIFGVVLFVCFV